MGAIVKKIITTDSTNIRAVVAFAGPQGPPGPAGSALVQSVNGKQGNVVLDATDVGAVESVVAGTNITVDNTDPQNPVVSSTGGITSVDWGDIDGTLSDQTDLQDALDDKVDKVTGKQLSTEDYLSLIHI